MGKSEKNKEVVKRLDPPEEERRKYLKTVGALVAGLAIGGAAAWLGKPAERVEVPGVTVTAPGVTETVTKTVTAPITPTPTPMEFKYGKTVWLLMPYTGEYWWVTCMEYLKRTVEADGWKFNFATAEGSDTLQSDQLISYAQMADILFVYPTSMEGINEAVRTAEEVYHCPVVICKDYITGKGRFCVHFNDLEAGTVMAQDAVKYIQKVYGTTEGKTVISLNGDLALSGWLERCKGFRWIKENHPEINFLEIIGGLTPEGWADVVDACIGAPGRDVVALLAGSDGPYLLGALAALEKYGKLYYAEDPKHVFIASIDGKPSTYMWLRHGYNDLIYPQTPDSIFTSLWKIAKDWILKDPSYEYPPYKMPEIPLPLWVDQPEGTYWGGKELVMKIDKVPYSETPIGRTPSPRVDRYNVNTWDLWGNKITKWAGKDPVQDVTFVAKGTEPAWCRELIDEYEEWLAK